MALVLRFPTTSVQGSRLGGGGSDGLSSPPPNPRPSAKFLLHPSLPKTIENPSSARPDSCTIIIYKKNIQRKKKFSIVN